VVYVTFAITVSETDPEFAHAEQVHVYCQG
jgi:hypothetical protein